jgi:translation initiation factor eIF-2B subunit alpha
MVIKKELVKKGINRANIDTIKETIGIQTKALADHSTDCKELIEKYSLSVLRDGMTILLHSYSNNVMRVLKSANERGIRINVLATESQPNGSGQVVKKYCDSLNIPCKVVLDSSVGLCMHEVDCVFVGANAVLENGGIVNSIGTFTVALCAKAMNKPFYVFTESLKFLKRFPLQQSDIFSILEDDNDLNDLSCVSMDYTAPEYISELFTDIGIFTPAAVSDELIKFF